ncbi:Transmembrane protein [Ceratobasidium theobromae]|uniref:Transmembrane protein n=1 Tax=Ceratobasidium theobromae TaxID=1582974 RepID=A0A5N5QLA5_9AGAM|nr:Transmembrane protein [Ceratobasidium theobromae]
MDCVVPLKHNNSQGVYSTELKEAGPAAPQKQKKITMAIWVFNSFVLDLCMTVVTVIFLYRKRADYYDHKSVFSTIWQVIWASAAPPLIVMGIVIVDGYLVTNRDVSLTPISAAMTAKCLVLSLMISLIGQGYIRRQFELLHHASPPNLSASVCPAVSRGASGATSEPVFAPAAETLYELQDRNMPGTGAANLDPNGEGVRDQRDVKEKLNLSDFSIAKPPEDSPTIHRVQLPLEA